MTGLAILTSSPATVTSVPMPLIYVADSWGGAWKLLTGATWERVVVFSGSEGTDRLEFFTVYGKALLPLLGGGFQAQDALDLGDKWAKLVFVDDRGSARTIFVGQVKGEERSVYGSDPDPGGSSARQRGKQRWTAYGGQIQLQRTAVSTSFWTSPPGSGSGDGVVELGWSPAFNGRDVHGLLKGNRSASKVGGKSYVFGGTDLWTRRQAAEYLIERFLNRTTVGRPKWTLGGQLAALDVNLRILEVGVSSTVEALLQKIMAHSEGLDYGIRPDVGNGTGGEVTGFEIEAFTLVAKDVTFLGATLPANPNIVTFSTADMKDVESLRLGTDRAHTCSRIRLVGDRILVCGTLLGPTLSGASSDDILSSTHSTLVGKWASSQETLYKAGNPDQAIDDDHDRHDNYRAQPQFAPVYLLYGLPAGYPRPEVWRPAFDGSGNLKSLSLAANWQDVVRETESWLPLRENYDYSTNPETALNSAADAEPSFLSPLVFAEDRKAEFEKQSENPDATQSADKIYSEGKDLQIGASALKQDFGVHISASPNHRLARGRGAFDGTDAAESRFDPADDEGYSVGAIDAKTLAVTIAWRSDARIALEFKLDETSDDGSVHEEAAPEMQCWWLAPDTVVNVNKGVPVKSGSTGRVLRNDADIYAPVMAGLIARYIYARTRADFTFHGWKAWLGILGSVLTTVEEGGTTHGVNAPITCVELQSGENGEPRTVVRAGFAK